MEGTHPNTLPRAPLAGIRETAVYVADLAVARAFYVDVMGCEPMLETPRLVACAAGEGSVLLLFQRGVTSEPLETPGGRVPGHGGNGVQHFAFAIARDAVDAWLARLAAARVAVESRVTWPRGGESIYLRDPDGHSVELVTPGLWPVE